jgi:hypothetical protein
MAFPTKFDKKFLLFNKYFATSLKNNTNLIKNEQYTELQRIRFSPLLGTSWKTVSHDHVIKTTSIYLGNHLFKDNIKHSLIRLH